MPGKPIKEEEGENTPQGRATGQRFTCRGSEQGYMWGRLHLYGVAFLDYPSGYVARNSPAEIFKEQREVLHDRFHVIVTEAANRAGGASQKGLQRLAAVSV
jgi:hypothetical protein